MARSARPVRLRDKWRIRWIDHTGRGARRSTRTTPTPIANCARVSTRHSRCDPEGRATIKDYLKEIPARVFPVGRLDFHTSGALLLTNDGDLAQALLHPRRSVAKTYVAKVRGVPTDAQIQPMRNGMELPPIGDEVPGVKTKPADVEVLRHAPSGLGAQTEDGTTWLKITLREGRNRQIHRMAETVGLFVMRLARIAFAGITTERLRPGELRPLTEKEVTLLRATYLRPVEEAAAAKKPLPRPLSVPERGERETDEDEFAAGEWGDEDAGAEEVADEEVAPVPSYTKRRKPVGDESGPRRESVGERAARVWGERESDERAGVGPSARAAGGERARGGERGGASDRGSAARGGFGAREERGGGARGGFGAREERGGGSRGGSNERVGARRDAPESRGGPVAKRAAFGARGAAGDRERGGGARGGFGAREERGGGARGGFGAREERGGGARGGFGAREERGGGARGGFGARDERGGGARGGSHERVGARRDAPESRGGAPAKRGAFGGDRERGGGARGGFGARDERGARGGFGAREERGGTRGGSGEGAGRGGTRGGFGERERTGGARGGFNERDRGPATARGASNEHGGARRDTADSRDGGFAKRGKRDDRAATGGTATRGGDRRNAPAAKPFEKPRRESAPAKDERRPPRRDDRKTRR